MTTKKKRRPTYEEIKRELTFAEQRNRMIVRQNDELARANLALSHRVNELMQTIDGMEMGNISRGYSNKIKSTRIQKGRIN
jgi:hypothetical protein